MVILSYADPRMFECFIWLDSLLRVDCQHLVDEVFRLGGHRVPFRGRILKKTNKRKINFNYLCTFMVSSNLVKWKIKLFDNYHLKWSIAFDVGLYGCIQLSQSMINFFENSSHHRYFIFVVMCNLNQKIDTYSNQKVT